MTAAEFSALLVLATASSFTPGPNTTLSAALAANGGMRRALHFVCAVPVGWGLLFALGAGGLGALVGAQPLLRNGILLGALTTIWIIVRCIKGILWLQQGASVPDPASWAFGGKSR